MASPNQEPALSRTEVRAFPCPACQAGAGERCRRVRGGDREANHQERVNHALHQLRSPQAKAA